MDYTGDTGSVKVIEAAEAMKSKIWAQMDQDACITWDGVPECIRNQYDLVKNQPYEWALANGSVAVGGWNGNLEELPHIAVQFTGTVPDGLIPWGDGGSISDPLATQISIEFVDYERP